MIGPNSLQVFGSVIEPRQLGHKLLGAKDLHGMGIKRQGHGGAGNGLSLATQLLHHPRVPAMYPVKIAHADCPTLESGRRFIVPGENKSTHAWVRMPMNRFAVG